MAKHYRRAFSKVREQDLHETNKKDLKGFTLHIPETWLCLLLGLPYYAAKAGMMCWREHSVHRGDWFSIQAAVRRQYGIPLRTDLRKAFLTLRQANLIKLERPGGNQATLIKVLRPDLSPPEKKRRK